MWLENILGTIDYSNWTEESNTFFDSGIYQILSDLLPLENTFEFGCGNGNSTFVLSEKRKVLTFENNSFLINDAISKLICRGDNVIVQKCDFFKLSETEKQLISDFEPVKITGWFIGSNGNDVSKYTKEEPDFTKKVKLYREKIEDIITSPAVCIPSVSTIQLANRGAIVKGFNNEQIFQDVKNDYDKYVFKKIGFEVVEVNVFNWKRVGSSFQYISAPNSILADGKLMSSITSIIARRI